MAQTLLKLTLNFEDSPQLIKERNMSKTLQILITTKSNNINAREAIDYVTIIEARLENEI